MPEAATATPTASTTLARATARAPRLSARQMAEFVAEGFLVFPGIIPEALNRDAMACFATESIADSGYRGERLLTRYRGTAIDDLINHPALLAIIGSMVGEDPIFDHHCLHVCPPHSGPGDWHQDAIIDAKSHFDLQLMYFPHHTPLESGGTMLLPGSHFRRINVFEAGHYQNFAGQFKTVCPGGTIVATHHNIWHASGFNRSESQRMMFKIRLAARVPQVRLFDMAGADSDEVRGILGTMHPWCGSDARLEVAHRALLWRLLSGDPDYDISYWLGRIENNPSRAVPHAARGWGPLPPRA